MKIKVLPPKSKTPLAGNPSFILVQDNWNDFGFKTQYDLHYLSDDGCEFIGAVKILKAGQTSGDGLLLDGDFQSLGQDYCSIGQSLDYYERLAGLPRDFRDYLLRSINDVVFYPEISKKFSSEVGWKTSLFRDFQENDEFILLARSLLSRDYTSLPAEDLAFSFSLPDWTKPLSLDFTPPSAPLHRGGRKVQELPSRMAVIIGRNGSGKSTLLARFARIAHASLKDRRRKSLKRVGEIVPDGIGFPRIITVSYSAFDSFQLPGVNPEEREQIIKDVQNGEGRFYYVGLRDIVGELSEDLSRNKILNDDPIVSSTDDRMKSNILKSLDVMAEEFCRNVRQIYASDRDDLLGLSLRKLSRESSIADIWDDYCEFGFEDDGLHEKFMSWSTGHKISLHLITSLVAYCIPRSIVLIDEPETHLHPPLLAALMHAIRLILRRTKSFAIVATHSPVVVQETMAKHVHVVSRVGSVTDIRPASIETFGENVGAITSEIFGLHVESTDYHDVLLKLAIKFKSLEVIESLFGFGLSLQARAYVMSLLVDNSADN